MGAPLTSANFDYLLLKMLARKMAYAGLDSITDDGTNADLLAGKLEAARFLGIIPSSPVAIVDDDLAGLADPQLPCLFAVAELVTLESILGNRAAPDQEAGTDNYQYHGKFYDSMETTVARKRTTCLRQYGYGQGTLTPGVMDLGFAATIDQASGIPV